VTYYEKSFKKVLYQKHKFRGVFQDSKMAKLLWMIKNDVDSHPKAERMKMLKEL
jgi:hypothetical protein